MNKLLEVLINKNFVSYLL